MTADAARRVPDGASDGASRDAAAAIADLFVALLRRLEERPEAVRALAERHEAEPARVRRSARWTCWRRAAPS